MTAGAVAPVRALVQRRGRQRRKNVEPISENDRHARIGKGEELVEKIVRDATTASIRSRLEARVAKPAARSSYVISRDPPITRGARSGGRTRSKGSRSFGSANKRSTRRHTLGNHEVSRSRAPSHPRSAARRRPRCSTSNVGPEASGTARRGRRRSTHGVVAAVGLTVEENLLPDAFPRALVRASRPRRWRDRAQELLTKEAPRYGARSQRRGRATRRGRTAAPLDSVRTGCSRTPRRKPFPCSPRPDSPEYRTGGFLPARRYRPRSSARRRETPRE